MKDNYSEMNVDMEQILFNKNYEDLSAAELDEIRDFVSSKEEFNVMKSTLMNVKTSFGTEEEIEPVDSAKENLMKMFNQKHGKVVPMNKPRPFYLNPVFQIGIAALFVLGIIYFYPKGENDQMTALNKAEEETTNEEESGKETTEVKAEESPEEESPASEGPALTEGEEMLEEDAVAEKSKDAIIEKKVNVTEEVVFSSDRSEVAQDLDYKVSAGESVKGDVGKKDAEKEKSELSALESTVYRSSSKNEKAKVSTGADDVTVDGTTALSNSGTTSLTFNSVTGGIAVVDELASTEKKEDKADEYKKDGKTMRTNTAGGYYMQPGKPAADLKEGVSLKDEPALSEFLFTAL